MSNELNNNYYGLNKQQIQYLYHNNKQQLFQIIEEIIDSVLYERLKKDVLIKGEDNG